MEPVVFADGFDGPDRVAFGLGAGGLGAVAGGLALGYLALHSGLPAPLDGLGAAICLLGAALLGWGRGAGRPLLDWAMAGLGYLRGPRVLTLRYSEAETRAASVPEIAPPSPAGLDPGAARSPTAEPAVRVASKRESTSPSTTREAVTASTARGPVWARWLEEPVARPAGLDALGEAGAHDGAGSPPVDEHPGPPAPEPTSWDHLNDELVHWVHERVRSPDVAPSVQQREPDGHDGRDAEARVGAGHVAAGPAVPLVVLPHPGAGLPPAPGNHGDQLELDGRPPLISPHRGGPHGTLRNRVGRGRARRVTFFGLSGGVGRTTLATEVGCLLAAGAGPEHPSGGLVPLRVAYVDLDPLGPAASLRLGAPGDTEGDPPAPGRRGRPLPDGSALHPSGLVTVWAPPTGRRADAGGDPAAATAAVLRQLDANAIDLILLDCNGQPPALATWVLETCDAIYIVLSDSARGVRDAYRSAASLRQLGFADKLAYVVNGSAGRVDFGPTMADLGGTLLTSIPEDPVIADAEDDHRIASLEFDSPGTSAIRQLAVAIHCAAAGAETRGAGPAGSWQPDHRAALGVR